MTIYHVGAIVLIVSVVVAVWIASRRNRMVVRTPGYIIGGPSTQLHGPDDRERIGL